MNEPIIVSKKKSLKVFNLICIIVGILAVGVFCIVVDIINDGYFSNYDLAYNVKYILSVPCKLYLLPILVLTAIVNIIFYISDFSITVYQDKVIGQAIFKKQVSLPMDSITAASTSMFHGVAVSTASGLIKFLMIENNKEIYTEINKIVEDRQRTKNTPNIIQQVSNQSSAQTLKEYKELLDSGVISQEEFDTKKKQLLGL